MVCTAGDGPFTGAENRSAKGVAESNAVLLTYMVTGMVSGLFGALAPVAGLTAVMVIEPSHLLPAATPDELTPTPNDPAVDAEVEPLKVNQAPPQVVAEVVAV